MTDLNLKSLIHIHWSVVNNSNNIGKRHNGVILLIVIFTVGYANFASVVENLGQNHGLLGLYLCCACIRVFTNKT